MFHRGLFLCNGMASGCHSRIIETAGYNIPQEVYTASIYLVFSNSMVNQIIYGVINPQFKLSCGRPDNGNANQNRTENGVRHERPRELGSET